MVTCHLCGSSEFEKHEGFMYCAVCQTQSQDYYEQEYEYDNHEINISRKLKSASTAKKSKTKTVCDDGYWTTWEAFNYILYGMTEEVKKCGASEEAGDMVLKLWAAYLYECNVAFTSKFQERMPKLGFGFKNRDARILYNVDLDANSERKRSVRSRSCSSKMSETSNSSLITKRSITLQKGKMVAAEYKDYVSLSAQSTNNLADETLESLGRSSDLEVSGDTSDSGDSQLKSLKNIINRKDYKLYKDVHGSKRFLRAARNKMGVGVRCLGKNKLLALLHLALLMTGSEIQLSDLLRFVRESHLSFAKVTHFFPKEMKFPKKDFTYIEIITDQNMPTHLAQRKILNEIARFVNVKEIPTPDIFALIDRYCLDLNLPKQIAEFGKKTAARYIPRSTAPKGKVFAPSFEAWAMGSIIVALKFFFGINDRTEIFLSGLAREINDSGKTADPLFVFQDWQKFIECRKTVLTNFHYPTEEQLGGTPFQSCKKFLGVLMKESKDEYRNSRFIRYPRYYIDEDFLNGVKNMLNVLSKTQNVEEFDFKPSLTPQVANLETILQGLSEQPNTVREDNTSSTSKPTLPESILRQDFKNCDVTFALDPKKSLNLLGENSDLFLKFAAEPDPESSFQEKNENLDVLFNCQARYWFLRFPEKVIHCNLNNFNERVLNKTPENFQWLVKECARMLEMNVRDLYEDLLRLEVLLNAENEFLE